MTTPTRTPQQVLLAAARIMKKRGKADGYAIDSNGRVCAIGAIGEACLWNWSGIGDRALERLRRSLRLREGRGLASWSDSHTAATVVAALRRAGGA